MGLGLETTKSKVTPGYDHSPNRIYCKEMIPTSQGTQRECNHIFVVNSDMDRSTVQGKHTFPSPHQASPDSHITKVSPGDTP